MSKELDTASKLIIDLEKKLEEEKSKSYELTQSNKYLTIIILKYKYSELEHQNQVLVDKAKKEDEKYKNLKHEYLYLKDGKIG